MSKQLGRISGPLLSANLLRSGTDLRFENQLLYLDVTNKTLSINSTPINKELFVDGTLRTDFIIIDAPKMSAGNLEIGPNNLIKAVTGTVILNGSNYVQAYDIKTDNLEITGQSISTYTTDTDIEIRPTGILDIYANTNITGNLHSTGNITADGSVIFGSNNLDSVTFDSDINSSLLPNADVTYSLGEDGKQWNDIRVKNLSGQIIYTGRLLLNNLSVEVTVKNQWFVASLGLDTNAGINESSAFATVAKALSVAESGDTVYIAPGTYTEVFPLTVPVGVTVKGAGVRSVTVQPTGGTNTNNAFLLNGETAVSDLTVTNFYQGYAFSFASGAKTTTRSPYIQNVSVITSGANAGRGALVDGAVVDPTSTSASMLFHSVTFITPGVNALTMTNGVRVEWLNSFTYFADRSLYATQGSLGFASLGVKFGAEVRAIASASVYGNYGAVADGADTLMYLIQYNFGYVGSGLDSSNDKTLVVQANEVTELNNGKIYYQSVDQQGNFRVGDEFFVDFDKGTTSIDISSSAITGVSSLTIGQEPNQTFIDYSKIDIGDFTIRGNNILTKSQAFDIVADTGEVNLTENVAVDKDLAVTGDVTIAGTITVGNQTSDGVEFLADTDSNIIPDTSKDYSLGSTDKRWKTLYSTETYIGDLKLAANEITAVGSDADLAFGAPGSVTVPFNNVEVSQTLQVNGTTSLFNVSITGDITHSGNYFSIVGVFEGADVATELGQLLTTENSVVLKIEAAAGDSKITGNVSATSSGKFSNITFVNNTIRSDNSLNFALLPGIGKFNLVSNNADISIKNNRIINNKNDPIVFSTNGGYVKFAGTSALVIPAGLESERPVAAETGTLRVNTTTKQAEVYTQPTDTWTDVTGLGDIATREVVEEYGNLWILILG